MSKINTFWDLGRDVADCIWPSTGHIQPAGCVSVLYAHGVLACNISHSLVVYILSPLPIRRERTLTEFSHCVVLLSVV